MFCAYVAQSIKTGRYYIGSGENPDVRLKRHNSGFTRSIKHDRPFKIIYIEWFKTKAEAYRRERQIKSYKSGEAFKKLVNK